MARAESVTTRPAIWPAPHAVPLGVRPFGIHNTNLGAAGERYAVAWTFSAPFALRGLEIVLPGWRLNPLESGGPEFPLPAPISVKMAVRVTDGPNSVNLPVLFGAQGRVGTLQPGGVLTGVANVPLRQGQQATLVAYLDPGASGRVPISVVTSAADTGVKHARGTSLSFDPDTWNGTATLASVAESTVAVMVFGLPDRRAELRPSVALLGDSITYGIGDAPTGWGYAVRALQGAGVPWVSCAVGGDFLGYSPWGGVGYRFHALRWVRWVLEAWGTNNITLLASFGLTDASNIKGAKVLLWRDLAKAGLGVATCTNTPVRNSGDSAADARATSIRQDLVTWQRDGAPWNVATGQPVAVGTTGANISRCLVLAPDLSVLKAASGPQHPVAVMFDTGRAVDINGGNQWASGMAVDDVHPSSAGAQAMAQAVATAVFRQEPPVYLGP